MFLTTNMVTPTEIVVVYLLKKRESGNSIVNDGSVVYAAI